MDAACFPRELESATNSQKRIDLAFPTVIFKKCTASLVTEYPDARYNSNFGVLT